MSLSPARRLGGSGQAVVGRRPSGRRARAADAGSQARSSPARASESTVHSADTGPEPEPRAGPGEGVCRSLTEASTWRLCHGHGSASEPARRSRWTVAAHSAAGPQAYLSHSGPAATSRSAHRDSFTDAPQPGPSGGPSLGRPGGGVGRSMCSAEAGLGLQAPERPRTRACGVGDLLSRYRTSGSPAKASGGPAASDGPPDWHRPGAAHCVSDWH